MIGERLLNGRCERKEHPSVDDTGGVNEGLVLAMPDDVNKSFDLIVTKGDGEKDQHHLKELVNSLMGRGEPQNRRPIPIYWDKIIKEQLAEYCDKTGVKFCEALEAGALLFIALHPTDRVNLILNVIQVVQPSREQLAEIKTEIERKLKPPTSKEETVTVQCPKCGSEAKAFKTSYEEGTRTVCAKCRVPRVLPKPKLLANAPNWYCPEHPDQVKIMAPNGVAPKCHCGKEMTLVLQPPHKPPIHRKRRKLIPLVNTDQQQILEVEP